MSQYIRVMLADDHAVVRSGLRRLFEQRQGLEVVAEADSGEQAYQLFNEHRPDVAVMDLTMPGMGGMEAIRRILGRHPAARVLVFSMHENPAFATQAIKAGARGYVCKTGEPDELVHAVHEVAIGRTYISAAMAQKIAMFTLSGEDDPLQQLSAREFEVFRLLAEGQTVEEIGTVLKISQKTVANYQTLIKQKLGIHSSLDLVRLAMRRGVIES